MPDKPHLTGITDDVLVSQLPRWLGDQDLRQLTLVCSHFNTLFNDVPLKTSRALLFVEHGKQTEAEAMVTTNHHILLRESEITVSNQTFSEITLLQRARWNLDIHMARMIVKHLPREEAAKQLRALSSMQPPAYIQIHGKHFDFEPIQTAYDNFNSYYDNANWQDIDSLPLIGRELNTLFLKICLEQSKLPAHVINEYRHPVRSFVINGKPPQFNAADEGLPRLPCSLYMEEKWKNGELLMRADNSEPQWGNTGQFSFYKWAMPALRSYTGFDSAAIRSLYEARVAEFMQLEQELNLSPEFESLHRLF